MLTNPTIPVEDMRIQALSSLEYANSYFRTFQHCLTNGKKRFNNDLLYDFAVLSLEKYFIALLARYDWNATHHMPLSLYKEAEMFEPEMPDSIKKTTILVGKFESICSLDGFGYHTPTSEELQAMEPGILEIKQLVENRLAELS
jgi:hypothetical protein